MSKQYDYIVVGGGTAGLVVAARLTENPEINVLVVEAGGDRTKDPLVLTPGLLPAVYGKEEYDWAFLSTPQARGRMLGGSSALNFFMVVFPGRAVLDAWGELGNEGWSFDALAPYFRKFGKTTAPPETVLEVSRLRGHYDPAITATETGPLPISFSEYNASNSSWMDAFAKLGLEATADPRSGTTFGAFQQAASIDPATHTRAFSASAYLDDAIRARPNLEVLTDTVVSRIVLETDAEGGAAVAKGVVVQPAAGGPERTIAARREVVLAAGALQSPQILELSGIGGRALLTKHGIPIVVDNPGVGENMQDHPIVCQTREVNDGVVTSDVLRDPALLQAVLALYQDGGQGPLGQSPISCAYAPLVDGKGILPVEARKALLDKTLPDGKNRLAAKASQLVRGILEQEKEPGVQFLLFPGQTNIKPTGDISGILVPARPQNCITVMTILNHPFSRGACHIASPRVEDKPVWDPRYNEVAADLEILANGVKFAETLVHTPPFADLFKKDGLRWPDLAPTDDEAAREIVRQAQISVFHVTGSCAMAPRELGGVVDSKLQVYGVKGLRVVDASVFPIEPLGNIQTTVYAVAEKAADLIKADW